MNVIARDVEGATPAGLPPELDPDTLAAAPGRSVLSRLHNALPWIALVAGLGGAAYLGVLYWTEWRFQVSTDDAYVQADIVQIAAQVAGTLTNVAVGDNEQVTKGQVLAVIDQRDYRAAVARAQADVAQAEAAMESTTAEIAQQQAIVSEIRATIDADKAAEVLAEQNNQRYSTLAHDGFGSLQNAQQATAAISTARATLAKDEAALDAAQKQVATLQARLEEAKAALAASRAQLEKAELDLGYTTIAAPEEGVVGNRELRRGQYVQPGTQLLDIVPLDKTYVVANFKETQLADVRPGQDVALTVDTFGGAVVRGFVQSLAPASGQEFALLPPDNATGNFTKVVQRIPVKILVDPGDPLAGKLRPGMSVEATIDIRPRPVPPRAAQTRP